MTRESILWFCGQAAAIMLAGWVGWRVAGAKTRMWKAAASIATVLMLGWPLMRFYPAHFIRWFGAWPISFLEVTGIVIPGVALFTIAACHVRTAGQRRAMRLMIPVCCIYFVGHGLWMVRAGVPDLGKTRMDGRACIQSTGYTCVAASMVSMLKAYGYEATETQMARLSYTEVENGTTDSRAVTALEAFLAGESIEVHYETMDYARLQAVPKPCMVPVRWGYFVSHMMPVFAASDQTVRLGDPVSGVTAWPVDRFLSVWHKRGIYLVDRRLAQRGPL
jgi:hypothetical protein